MEEEDTVSLSIAEEQKYNNDSEEYADYNIPRPLEPLTISELEDLFEEIHP